jgi:hypothetical protein
MTVRGKTARKAWLGARGEREDILSGYPSPQAPRLLPVEWALAAEAFMDNASYWLTVIFLPLP